MIQAKKLEVEKHDGVICLVVVCYCEHLGPLQCAQSVVRFFPLSRSLREGQSSDDGLNRAFHGRSWPGVLAGSVHPFVLVVHQSNARCPGEVSQLLAAVHHYLYVAGRFLPGAEHYSKIVAGFQLSAVEFLYRVVEDPFFAVDSVLSIVELYLEILPFRAQDVQPDALLDAPRCA